MYTINDFWIPTLGHASASLPAGTLPAGWATDINSLSTFVEAPLEMADEFGQQVPYPILLVSSPGAVGKSTLAREIAAQTGAVFVDLAQAEAVGSSTVSGGLAWADLFNGFRRGDVALMLDGLDEARMQVTEASFAAFLEDICKLARAEGKPITLFGRTAAAEEAWLHFAEMGFDPPVLEIQFHGRDSALDFVMRRIANSRTEQGENVEAAADADRKAARHILDSLEQQAKVDGDRFVGYAPVLIAVSKRVTRPAASSGSRPPACPGTCRSRGPEPCRPARRVPSPHGPRGSPLSSRRRERGSWPSRRTRRASSAKCRAGRRRPGPPRA